MSECFPNGLWTAVAAIFAARTGRSPRERFNSTRVYTSETIDVGLIIANENVWEVFGPSNDASPTLCAQNGSQPASTWTGNKKAAGAEERRCSVAKADSQH